MKKEICEGKNVSLILSTDGQKIKLKLVKKFLLVYNQLKSNRNVCIVVNHYSLKCENIFMCILR